MKRNHKKLSSRAIKRKLKKEGADLGNLLEQVKRFADSDMFTSFGENDVKCIVIEKNELMGILKKKIYELESEWENIQDSKMSVNKQEEKKEIPIKINIS